jgi:glycosyltransferase involved in cell wall biosynthesis
MTFDNAEPILSGVSACFPAFNDEHTIGQVVRDSLHVLREITDDFEIIVANDGSCDGTRRVLEKAASEIPQLRVVQHAINQGYGAALRSAFSMASKPWIFYTDGDGQYDPAEMQLLAREIINSVDVVNGYKTCRQDPLYRRLVGHVWQMAARTFFAIRIRDVDCDFRLFRRALINPEEMISRSGGFSLELVLRLQRAGARFREIPVSHYPRSFGYSQFFRMQSLLATAMEVADLWWKLVLKSPHGNGKGAAP